MSAETQKVLQMLQDGQIDISEAEQLLERMNKNENGKTGNQEAPVSQCTGSQKFLRIEVHSDNDDIKINIPVGLIKAAMKFIPAEVNARLDEYEVDLDSILDAIEEGAGGEIVNIQQKDGESVTITLD